MSKFQVPTFDSMCCWPKTRVFSDSDHRSCARYKPWLFSPLLVPGSHHPAGAATGACAAPAPAAAWKRGSISGSSAAASPFAWCRRRPPPAGQRLELHSNASDTTGSWGTLWTWQDTHLKSQGETYFWGFAGHSVGRSLFSQPATHLHDQCSVCIQLLEDKTENWKWEEKIKILSFSNAVDILAELLSKHSWINLSGGQETWIFRLKAKQEKMPIKWNIV